MSETSRLLPTYIEATTEAKLQEKLTELKLATGKMPNIISIYPRGSKVYAWVHVDMKYLRSAPTEDEQVLKKKTKKKRTKKASE
jgi:hypothetical protein